MEKIMVYALTSSNKRLTLRRLFGGSGLRKTAVGASAFVRFSLRHIFCCPKNAAHFLYRATKNVVNLER
jgi:hypothetical protein